MIFNGLIHVHKRYLFNNVLMKVGMFAVLLSSDCTTVPVQLESIVSESMRRYNGARYESCIILGALQGALVCIIVKHSDVADVC